MKTVAQRKADERTRRRLAGFIIVQEWVHKRHLQRAKKYLSKLRLLGEKT